MAFRRIALAGSLILMTAAALAPGGGASKADEELIRAVLSATEAANNEGDVDAWLALFAPEAVYMAPGAAEVRTTAGLRRVAEAGFSANATTVTIEPQEIVVCGDWAFARTRVTGSAVSRASGKVYPVDVKQIVVYQRQDDGAWLIARLISNSNLE